MNKDTIRYGVKWRRKGEELFNNVVVADSYSDAAVYYQTAVRQHPGDEFLLYCVVEKVLEQHPKKEEKA